MSRATGSERRASWRQQGLTVAGHEALVGHGEPQPGTNRFKPPTYTNSARGTVNTPSISTENES